MIEKMIEEGMKEETIENLGTIKDVEKEMIENRNKEEKEEDQCKKQKKKKLYLFKFQCLWKSLCHQFQGKGEEDKDQDHH